MDEVLHLGLLPVASDLADAVQPEPSPAWRQVVNSGPTVTWNPCW